MTLLPTKLVLAHRQGCYRRNLLAHDDAPDALDRRTSASGNYTVGLLLAGQRRPPCRPERPLGDGQQSYRRKGPMQIVDLPLVARERATMPDPL